MFSLHHVNFLFLVKHEIFASGGKYNKETHQTSAAPNVIFINIDGDSKGYA